MSVYNLLKSGTVVLGLATGSAALAAGINSLGSLMGGETWERASSAIDPLPETGGAYVADGGTVTTADLSLLELGESAATYASDGTYVPTAVVVGAGSYSAKTEAAAARRATLVAQGYDLPQTMTTSTGTTGSAPAVAVLTSYATTAAAVPTATPATTAVASDDDTGSPSAVLPPAQALATLSPSSDDDATAGEPVLVSADPTAGADPIVSAVVAPVPVPAGGLLLASALIGVGVMRRKRA